MPVATRVKTQPRQSQSARPALRPISLTEVAKVAYMLFEKRGHAHGFDQQDWFKAEQIVRSRSKGRNGD